MSVIAIGYSYGCGRVLMLLSGQKSRATECGWSHCHPVCSPPWCSQAIYIALSKTRASRARVALKCIDRINRIQHAAEKWMMIDITHTHTLQHTYHTITLHHATSYYCAHCRYICIYRIYRYYIPVSQTNLPHEPAAGVWTDQTIAGTKGKESSWGVVATSLAGPSRPWSWTCYRGNDHRRWRERERERERQRETENVVTVVTVRQGIPSRGGYAALHWDWNCHELPFTSIYIHLHVFHMYFTSIWHPFQSSILISSYIHLQ